MSTTAADAVAALLGPSAPALAVGDRVRIICPQCGGGSSRERSMLFSRDRLRYSWHCFRANCGAGGSQLAAGGQYEEPATEREPLRPYLGPTTAVDDETSHMVWRDYGVDTHDWRMTHDGRFLLPIYTTLGAVRGHVARRPWWDKVSDGAPKTLTYWNLYGPLLAWYMDARRSVDKVLLVEDQLSAMRYRAFHDVATCALLGTGINEEKIAEIQSVSRNVVIALDADATGQAFAMARKWGQAFDACRVQVLSCDIKDMEPKDLTNLVI